MDISELLIILALFAILLFCCALPVLLWVFSLQQKLDKQVKRLNKLESDLAMPSQVSSPTPGLLAGELGPSSSETSPSVSPLAQVHAAAPTEVTSPPVEPPQAKSPAALQPSHKSTSASGFDWEQLLMGNLLNKIGAVIVLIGVFLFAKLVTPYVFFTPALKALGGAVVGAVLLAVGLGLHRKAGFLAYAEVLMGTGFGILIMIDYGSCTIFKVQGHPLLNETQALMVGCGLIMVMYWLALYMQRTSLLLLTLVAAYFNIVFIDTSFSFLAVYLILVNWLCLAGALRCQMWNGLVTVNVAISMLCIYTSSFSFHDSQDGWSAAFFAIIWASYAFSDLLRLKEPLSSAQQIATSRYSYVNFALIAAAALALVPAGNLLSGLLVLVAMLYFTARFCFHHLPLELNKAYLHLSILSLMLGLWYLSASLISVYILSLAAGLLALVLARRSLHYAAAWPSIYLLMACVTLIMNWDSVHTFGDLGAFFISFKWYELSCPLFAVLSVAWLCMWQGYTRAQKREALSDNELGSIAEIFASNAYFARFAAVTVAFAWLFAEASDFAKYFWPDLASTAEFLIFCLLLELYALQAILQGRQRRNWFFGGLGYLAFLLQIIALGVFCVFSSTEFLPIFNLRMLVLVIGMAVGIFLRRSADLPWQKSFWGVMALFLGFAAVHTEFTNLAKLWDVYSMTTIGWAVYAALLVIIGLRRHKLDIRVGGLFIIALACLRLFFYDLSSLASIYKLLVFLVTGATLMALSYWYTSFSRSMTERENVSNVNNEANLDKSDVLPDC